MNISDEDVLYENKWLIIDYCIPFSISGLLSSQETDIGQMALARGSISFEGW